MTKEEIIATLTRELKICESAQESFTAQRKDAAAHDASVSKHTLQHILNLIR